MIHLETEPQVLRSEPAGQEVHVVGGSTMCIEGTVCGIATYTSQETSAETEYSRPAWALIGPQSPMYVPSPRTIAEQSTRRFDLGVSA